MGGYVSHLSAGRPTKSHEYLFLLSKSESYYYDSVAIAEPSTGQQGSAANFKRNSKDHVIPGQSHAQHRTERGATADTGTRNKRDVWTISTESFSGAHFATFPPALVEPCILAGTSAAGACPACGASWERVVDHTKATVMAPASEYGNGAGRNDGNRSALVGAFNVTTGWRQSCACPPAAPVPATVLDPFAGSGTTGQVARLHSRRFVGLDINGRYLRELALPRAEGTQTAASLATLPMFAQVTP